MGERETRKNTGQVSWRPLIIQQVKASGITNWWFREEPAAAEATLSDSSGRQISFAATTNGFHSSP